jgi:hypothetical protein
MKKTIMYLVVIAIPLCSFTQSPQKMSYQCVVRNSSGVLVANQGVGFKISILQGSSTGAIVYQEIYNPNPQTNSNGLVSLEIGGGIPVTGTFSNINWSTGLYFLKTETDPTGATNYTISGISQLLSVPYALYAERSGGASGVNKHYVTEFYGGGIVFWVDHTGNHGLICSLIDLSTTSTWSDVTNIAVGPSAQSDWDGQSNTVAIVAQSISNSAADLCNMYINEDYGTGIFSDWYLPSRDELNDLWNNITAIQKALTNDGNPSTTPIGKNNYYWSSSEIHSYDAWDFYIGNGWAAGHPKNTLSNVRAVRAF